VEIRGDPNSVEMIVKLEARENTEPSRYLCQGLIGLYLLEQPNCDGFDINVPQESRKLTTIYKTGKRFEIHEHGVNSSFNPRYHFTTSQKIT